MKILREMPLLSACIVPVARPDRVTPFNSDPWPPGWGASHSLTGEKQGLRGRVHTPVLAVRSSRSGATHRSFWRAEHCPGSWHTAILVLSGDHGGHSGACEKVWTDFTDSVRLLNSRKCSSDPDLTSFYPFLLLTSFLTIGKQYVIDSHNKVHFQNVQ